MTDVVDVIQAFYVFPCGDGNNDGTVYICKPRTAGN